MRKSYNAMAEARTTDYFEAMKRLHNMMELIKNLDDQKSYALMVSDIFDPSIEALREKVKDYYVKLILKDLGNANKIEGLLWRKVFYEVVCTAKKLRKNNDWTDLEKELLLMHLTVGVGYYHHLILKLQMEYDLNLIGIVDFAYIQLESISLYAKNKISQYKTHNKEVKKCAMHLIHRCLVCLGDLSRYKLEVDLNWDPTIANRYYKMAIAIDPNLGMPYNQLGTIAGHNNHGLDAVYYFLKSVLCREPFERAEENLRRNILIYSTCIDTDNFVHYCVSRLFSLLRLWDQENPYSDKINQECQALLTSFENCLTLKRSNSLENTDNIETNRERNQSTLYLTDDMKFKIVAICLMSISRLKSKESSEVQSVVAVTLAILSQLLQFTIKRLQETIMRTDVEGTLYADAYSSNLKNTEDSQVLSKHESNENQELKSEESTVGQVNSVFNSNETNKLVADKKSPDNGTANESNPKKIRERSKYVDKFRRKRRIRIDSDSDTSDVEQSTLASSSDDQSETEEDDVLSDNGLSDNNTDDEVQITENTTTKEEMNGHASEVSDKTEHCDKKDDTNHLVNGEQHAAEQADSKTTSDKDSMTNSNSVTTITTNAGSTSSFDDTNSRLHNQNTFSQLKKCNWKSDDILDMLIDKEVLASIKVCCDWLRSNPDIVRICTKSSRTLLKRLAILLNLIDIDTDSLVRRNSDLAIFSSAERLKLCERTVPLPEDIDLKGLNLLEDAHKSLDWQILRKHRMNKREQTLLRILKLIEFGHYLTSVQDSGVRYDEAERMFVVADAHPANAAKTTNLNEKNFGMDHSRGKLMRHMGKLWLKAEVRALESQLRSRLVSPFLVPDHEAMIKHMPILKRLVYTKKFIVVIPSVVISVLDEMKRVSCQAREATRWLETQLRRGSRFLRAQRPLERLTLPLIKGPKPKDREAWLFFQIIECCYYLTQQAKMGFTGDGEVPVVTLLTGNLDGRKVPSFSPTGLAESAGVNLEYIESFQTKWKSSSKSHG